MQQKINPENENEFSSQESRKKNFKIIKCKGKPFWLNLTKNKKRNYDKYKTQNKELDSKMQLSLNQSNRQSNERQNIQQKEESEFLQSIQSANQNNQNYEDDFESYQYIQEMAKLKKQTKNNQLGFIYKKNQQTKKINASQNKIVFNSLQISPKKQCKDRCFNSRISCKTEQNQSKMSRIKLKFKSQEKEKQKQSSTIDIERIILFSQNTLYLKSQSEKLIRKIQQLRAMIPIALKNNMTLFQQNFQLNQLRNKAYRATSSEYQYEIESSKQFLQLNQRQLQWYFKRMNSSKNIKKSKKILNNQFIQQPSYQYKLRQQLLHQMRLFFLRQQKEAKLDDKLNMYFKIMQKLSQKQKIQKMSSLQRRKVFLQWDIQKMKNEIDLTIIEDELQINQLKNQLENINLVLKRNEEIIKLQKEQIKDKSAEKQIKSIYTIIKPQNIENSTKNNILDPKLSPNKTIFQQKTQKSSIFKRKRLDISNYQRSDTINIFQKRTINQKQTKSHLVLQEYPSVKQEIILNKQNTQNSKKFQKFNNNLSQFNFKITGSLRQKKQLIKQNWKQTLKNKQFQNEQQKNSIKPTIRIKKSMFKNAQINEEIQELIL